MNRIRMLFWICFMCVQLWFVDGNFEDLTNPENHIKHEKFHRGEEVFFIDGDKVYPAIVDQVTKDGIVIFFIEYKSVLAPEKKIKKAAEYIYGL